MTKITMTMLRPVKVESIATYKLRMEQIYEVQIASAFKAFGNWFMWLLVFWTLPHTIIYTILCIVDSLIITIFLPILLIPGLRWLGLLPECIIIAIYTIIANFGGVQQNDIYY